MQNIAINSASTLLRETPKLGHLITALSGLDALSTWLSGEDERAMADAISTQFRRYDASPHSSREFFRSTIRQRVEDKYILALATMQYHLSAGNVELRRAGDVSCPKDFIQLTNNSGTWHTMQFDPLSGNNRIFREDGYYYNVTLQDSFGHSDMKNNLTIAENYVIPLIRRKKQW